MAAPAGGPRALLLDIEGTTTPLSFVADVLFPYARVRLAGFLARRGADPDVRADLARLRAEHAADVHAGASPPPWEGGGEGALAYLGFLMDRDRKSTGLKALQGRIWEEGYRAGELRSTLYEDVPRAFARWRGQGRTLAVYSSGSVQAQKLLFAHTTAGDLTAHLSAFFDTTTGPKKEAGSYRAVARALGLEAGAVLFLSDVAAELDAARAAGTDTALCVREAAAPPSSSHRVIATFDEVCP
ncbi:MAG TPA: acireductone synthase [Vicinamibacteria bacterium]